MDMGVSVFYKVLHKDILSQFKQSYITVHIFDSIVV